MYKAALSPADGLAGSRRGATTQDIIFGSVFISLAAEYVFIDPPVVANNKEWNMALHRSRRSDSKWVCHPTPTAADVDLTTERKN